MIYIPNENKMRNITPHQRTKINFSFPIRTFLLKVYTHPAKLSRKGSFQFGQVDSIVFLFFQYSRTSRPHHVSN